MSMFGILGIVLSTVALTFGAVAIGPATINAEHPDQCMDEKTNMFYHVGESWPVEGCAEATCSRNGGSSKSSLVVSYATCGAARVSPSSSCYMYEDHSKNYPGCCPQPVCSGNSKSQLMENEGFYAEGVGNDYSMPEYYNDYSRTYDNYYDKETAMGNSVNDFEQTNKLDNKPSYGYNNIYDNEINGNDFSESEEINQAYVPISSLNSPKFPDFSKTEYRTLKPKVKVYNPFSYFFHWF